MKFPGLILAWILAAPLAGQVVEGRVVNAVTGSAVPSARISIFQGGDVAYRTVTDQQGNFRIENAAEGVYKAVASAPGFSPIPDPDLIAPSFRVAAAAGPVRFEIKLPPLPKVSGRVIDGTGKLVPNAELWFIKGWNSCKPPVCSAAHFQTKAGEHGEFTATNINFDGTWQVAATAPPFWKPPDSVDGRALAWAQTFYGDVTDPQLAAGLTLRPGTDLWNVDIKLAATPAHRIHGRVLDAPGKVKVALDSVYGPTVRLETKDDGTFEFPAVADGEWRVSATLPQGGTVLWGAEFVSLKDRDLENVELRLNAPFTLRARIEASVPEGLPAPPLPRVDLLLLSRESVLADPREDFGNYPLLHVYPGKYMVLVLANSTQYFLDTIRLGDRDAAGSDVAIMSDSQPLILTYKIGGGTVRGSIEGCGGANVILVPQELVLRRNGFFGIARCDAAGRFEISSVRPGEYYGLAIAGPDPEPVLDEGLLKQAARVTVRANETTSPDLRVLR